LEFEENIEDIQDDWDNEMEKINKDLMKKL